MSEKDFIKSSKELISEKSDDRGKNHHINTECHALERENSGPLKVSFYLISPVWPRKVFL